MVADVVAHKIIQDTPCSRKRIHAVKSGNGIETPSVFKALMSFCQTWGLKIRRLSTLCGPVTGTTRIITCSVGNLYKPSFATVTRRGPPNTYQSLGMKWFSSDRTLRRSGAYATFVGWKGRTWDVPTKGCFHRNYVTITRIHLGPFKA